MAGYSRPDLLGGLNITRGSLTSFKGIGGDAAKVADLYDDIPQNGNFAIRGEIPKLFLAQNGVDPMSVPPGSSPGPEDLTEVAQDFTRLITCN